MAVIYIILYELYFEEAKRNKGISFTIMPSTLELI
jgi:hypothetical protein